MGHVILESENSTWERKTESFVGLGCQILCMGGAKRSFFLWLGAHTTLTE